MKSNRAVGNSFEQELCERLFAYGFWAHNLKQDNSGQPADVLAVRNQVAYLIDCKDCSAKGFDRRRIEENQKLAMELWEQCGNGQGWFALRIDERVYMLPLMTLVSYKNNQASLSFEDIFDVALPLEKWVMGCR